MSTSTYKLKLFITAIILTLLCMVGIAIFALSNRAASPQLPTPLAAGSCAENGTTYSQYQGYARQNEFCQCYQGELSCREYVMRTLFISTTKDHYPTFLRTEFYATDGTVGNSYYKNYIHEGDSVKEIVPGTGQGYRGIDFETDYIFISQLIRDIRTIQVAPVGENWVIGITYANPPQTQDRTAIYYNTDPNSRTDKNKLWESDSMGAIKNIKTIDQEYIQFEMSACEFCAPKVVPNSTYILNLKSKQVVNLGLAGEIQVNSATKKVTYRALKDLQLPCTDSAVNQVSCADDTDIGIGYKPSGDIITKTLP
jgi:hypothetical protein